MSPAATLGLSDRVGLLEEKFAVINKDLSHNVTKIYGRDDLLTAIDLIFHSVLSFVFLGNVVRKGWVEGLVLGDTGCGKTTVAEALMKHYQAGEMIRGEGATFAGLIGGVQQVSGSGRWSVTWGTLPLQDRRFVTIDEVSGLPVTDISDMSGVRSDGIAQLTKIHQEKTFARTRLLWISNPRSNRSLASYATGVDAVRELIGRPEDIRRFDFALTLASNEVPSDVINRRYSGEEVPHVYTSELCHNQVLWAWSRKMEQIVFDEEAEDIILERAKKLGAEYHSSIPLVEPADQRIKLARLAVAAAARVFSSDDEGERVMVRGEHCEFIYRFLDKIYKKKSLAYDLYSRQRFSDEKLANPDVVREALEEQDIDFVNILLDMSFISMADIEVLADLDRIEAKQLLSIFVRNRCLKRARSGFFKTPAFIELLKQIKENGFKPKEVTSKDEEEPF